MAVNWTGHGGCLTFEHMLLFYVVLLQRCKNLMSAQFLVVIAVQILVPLGYHLFNLIAG